MIRGLLMKPPFEYEEIELQDLDDYQDAVEGYFEVLPLVIPHPVDDGFTWKGSLYVNDQGRLGQFDPKDDRNMLASSLSYIGGIFTIILGPAVLVGGPNSNGDDTDWNLDYVATWLDRIIRLNKQPKEEENVQSS